MNYFAHGMRFVHRPYFLAGTAIPDWMNVADRRVRVRPNRVEPLTDGPPTEVAELAAGVLQHFEDDRLFHKSRAFIETSGTLTRMFREAFGPDDGFRHSFLGHVVTEMLLDAVLIAEQPDLLDDYYRAFDEIEPLVVEQAVNRMARNQTSRLAPLIPMFRESEFLRDYPQSDRLLFRLNQVLKRIRLKPLPERAVDVLDSGRSLVAEHADDLLPFGREHASRPAK